MKPLSVAFVVNTQIRTRLPYRRPSDFTNHLERRFSFRTWGVEDKTLDSLYKAGEKLEERELRLHLRLRELEMGDR